MHSYILTVSAEEIYKYMYIVSPGLDGLMSSKHQYSSRAAKLWKSPSRKKCVFKYSIVCKQNDTKDKKL